MIRPEYRLTLYKPKSQDATEAAVLVPVIGGVHSDSFQLTTEEAPPAGWKPYLSQPAGRTGRMDPVTKRIDTGELSASILEKNVAGHSGTNLRRWVTAFLGDTTGRPMPLQVKAKWEVSYDGGSTWNTYFTGRVSALQKESKSRWRIVTRDRADELEKTTAFTSRVHSSITYASDPMVLPIGTLADFGPVKATTKLTGTMATDSLTGARYVQLDAASMARADNMVTAAFMRSANMSMVNPTGGAVTSVFGAFVITPDPDTRVRVWATSPSVSGKELVPLGYMARPIMIDAGLPGSLPIAVSAWRISRLFVGALQSSDPYYTDLAALTNGTAVEVAVIRVRLDPDDEENPEGGASKDTPFLIGDVHCVQLIKDLLDGKFGELDSTGAVKRAIPYNSSNMTAFIADATLPTMRFIVDKVWPVADFIEKHILQATQLGWYINAAGEVVLVDLRLSSTSAGTGPLTDAHLLNSQEPEFSIDHDDAITRCNVATYLDVAVGVPSPQNGATGFPFPEWPVHGVRSYQEWLRDPNFGNSDFGDRKLVLDLQGFRAFEGETMGLVSRRAFIKGKAVEAMEQYRLPFGNGVMAYRAKFRRYDSTGVLIALTDCKPGDLRTIQITHLPDPGTGLYGGLRLMRCLEATPDAEGIWLSFLDCGAGVVLSTPSLASYAKMTADPKHGVQVVITLNANGDPVQVDLNVTETSVGARPADTDAAWHSRPWFDGGLGRHPAGTVLFRALPAGKRIWMRARSIPKTGQVQRLPSAFVYPSAHVDLDALAAPTSLSVTSITTDSALVTWSNNGDTTSHVEIRLSSPASDPLATIATLVPGTTSYQLTGLASHTGSDRKVGVRHTDLLGGTSTEVTSTFTPSGTPATCPDMGGVVVLTGLP